MDLTLKEVAEWLGTSEQQVELWVGEGRIPGYRFCETFRFNRHEVENWLFSQHAVGIEPPFADQQYNFYRALHRGGLLEEVAGSDKEQVIRNAIAACAPSLGVDADVVTDLLLEREMLMATGLNHGIAVPHARENLLSGPHDVVVTAYLKTPVDYGSLDREPVNTLFFLFSCSDKSHLQLLAKLAHFSAQSAMRDFLRSRPNRERLLEGVRQWEQNLNPTTMVQ